MDYLLFKNPGNKKEKKKIDLFGFVLIIGFISYALSLIYFWVISSPEHHKLAGGMLIFNTILMTIAGWLYIKSRDTGKDRNRSD